LLAVNANRCDPPLGESEVRGIARSIGRYQPADKPAEAAGKLDRSELQFPERAMIGSLGAFAEVMAAGTEVPEEFYFTAALTIFGNACGPDLGITAMVDAEPRLYTVLLGESYSVKKSSALKRTVEFFKDLWTEGGPQFCHGLGSAEGLAKVLAKNNRCVLWYDELRALLDKTRVQGSVLLSTVTSLFESTDYQNHTRKESIVIKDAHLSLVSCCTTDTYAHIWTTEAIAIGLVNRLFVVAADRRPKVSWPEPPNTEKLKSLRSRIASQRAKATVLDITADAKRDWDAWYKRLSEESIHVNRLDTIGFRLMSILAITTDKDVIDAEVVAAVTAILDYELRVRTLVDPIDADNTVAKLEQNIRRVLSVKGPLTLNRLRQSVGADRAGLWLFERAIANLVKPPFQIVLRTGKEYQLNPEIP
jgi:hypothetical protein